MKITLPKTLEKFKLDYDTGWSTGYHEGYRQCLIDQEEDFLKELEPKLEGITADDFLSVDENYFSQEWFKNLKK